MFPADTPLPTIDPTTSTCPCGSGHLYSDCCGPAHNDDRPARTAEALMRSRYCAFVLGNFDYLMATLAAEHRPQPEQLEQERQEFLQQQKHIQWTGLSILKTIKGKRKDPRGQVLFEARFTEANQSFLLRENSRFRQTSGRWYYIDGDAEVVS